MGLFGSGNDMSPAVRQLASTYLKVDERTDFEYLYKKYSFSKQQMFRSADTRSPTYRQALSIFLNNVGFELRRHGQVDDALRAFRVGVSFSENGPGLTSVALILAERGDGAACTYARRYVTLYERERATTKTAAESYIDSINPFAGDDDHDLYVAMKELADAGDD